VTIYAHTLAGHPQTDWELLETHLYEIAVAAAANAAPFAAEKGLPFWVNVVTWERLRTISKTICAPRTPAIRKMLEWKRAR
jgi:hypothetical protein